MTAIEDQARSIFLAALEREPEDWPAFLNEACVDNSELRERVEQLLHSHQALGSIHCHEGNSPTVIVETPGEGAGAMIGPYKLLQQIGEGGMGVVYMAEQNAPVRRKVALKIIKPGMDTREVIARFESERQALALMDHPNIARVFDAGATETGRPYFVMELVRGVTFTDYCDQNDLPIHERLELFVTVCHAVQHAHQKGIIHRDIKPSNVLVTLHDGRAVPKVIDFGLAKAIGQQLTDQTLFTQFAQMVGTPLYMSPEQAELTGLDIDTRADIYSLGVMLYELLTGTTPFDSARMKQVAVEEIRRILREEDPPSPSTRLSSTAGETQTAVAAHRHIDPKGLSRLVRGELDWIVMKSLEKDRSRRYETANGLSRDLERYLADEAVEACPPSTAYRLRKFVRRNKGKLFTAVLLALALVAGTVVSTWQAIRAGKAEELASDRLAKEQEAREEAEANLQRARELVDEYFTLVSDSKLLDVPVLQPLRKELLQSALKYYEGFVRQRTGDSSILADLAATELRITQIMYVNGERADRFMPHLERGVTLTEQLVREGRDTREVRAKLAGYMRSNPDTDNYEPGGTPIDPDFSLGILGRHAALWEKFMLENPDLPGFQSDLAGTYLYMATVQFKANRHGLASFSIGRAVDLFEGLVREYPAEPRYRLDLSRMYDSRSQGFSALGFANEAKQDRDKTLALREKLVAEFPDIPVYRTWLARSYREAGDYAANFDEAQQLYLKSLERFERLAAEYPADQTCQRNVALTTMNLGDACLKKRLPAEAAQHFKKAAAAFETLQTLPSVHWKDGQSLVNAYRKLSQALAANRELEEAELTLRSAVAVIDNQSADQSATTKVGHREPRQWAGHALWELGDDFWLRFSRPNDAEQSYRKAAETFRQLAADYPENPFLRQEQGFSYWKIGWVLNNHNRPQEAEEPFRQGLAVYKQLVADYPHELEYGLRVTRGHYELSTVLARIGKAAEGQQELKNAAAEATRLIQLKPDNWQPWSVRASDYFHLQDWNAAITDFSKAIELAPTVHANWWHRAHSYVNLAQWDKAAADFKAVVDRWPEGSEGWYLLAVSLVKLNQPEEAITDLRQAIAHGFRNVDWIKTDSRLNPLRTREDFGELLREFEQKIKSESK